MTRYVLSDLEQVGAELSRRAEEITNWLDSAAGRGSPGGGPAPPEDGELARAIAELDLLCYHALSATAVRLAGAAESVAACAKAIRGVDAEVAERIERVGR